MNKILLFVTTLCMLSFVVFPNNSELHAQTDIWASAYYAGWMQNSYLPAQNVDYTAMTHIIHFAIVPRADGTLNDSANSVTASNANALVTRAHAAGKKVIISVGGWNTDVGFRGATSDAIRALFISNLITLMTSRDYDGIDIDWEPFDLSDGPQYIAFITALRTALNAISPRPLLTAATGASMRTVLAQVHQHFDQINLMTYDYSGAWPGWVTWHNAPIYDGGFVFPSTGGPVPSANRDIDRTIAAGVPASKLGIGIDFYGYIWNGGDGTPTGGVTAPRQGWTTAPSVQGNVPYYIIMRDYYQEQYYRWDSATFAAYLSIDLPGTENDKFISYDDQRTIQHKIQYVRNKGIGGAIIWELGGGYRASLPAGQRDSLLQAVKTSLYGTTGVSELGEVPTAYELSQNYPNPFNPSTVIKYALPQDARVSLEVYNALGQLVASLANNDVQATGQHAITLNATGLSSGVYFYRLTAHPVSGDQKRFIDTKKMIFTK